jgi:hypothetical protein
MPTWSRVSLQFNVFEFSLQQVGAPTVPSAVLSGSNELVCHKCVIVSHCVKK